MKRDTYNIKVQVNEAIKEKMATIGPVE